MNISNLDFGDFKFSNLNISNKGNVLGTLSSFQTILENYPKLFVSDYIGGKDTTLNAISFLLDILKMIGISTDDMYKWLSDLLLDESETVVGKVTSWVDDTKAGKGLLIAIETAIKTVIYQYLTSLYTCPVDPAIPDYFLRSPYPESDLNVDMTKQVGISIPIEHIDMFGLLQNCPWTKEGGVFYFDVDKNHVNKSTDFNAWLWYVINRGATHGNAAHECVWDNRVLHRVVFYKHPERQSVFVNTKMPAKSIHVIKEINAVKTEILYASFTEGAGAEGELQPITVDSLNQSNYLTVWGVADRYKKQGVKIPDSINIGIEGLEGVRLNKTISEFNGDYIFSLKLFSAKTLVAQVCNTFLGFTSALTGRFSTQRNLIVKRMEQLVEKVLNQENPLSNAFNDNSFFSFSDSDYEVENDANIQYNLDGVMSGLEDIENAISPEQQGQALIGIVQSTAEALMPTIEDDDKDIFTKDIFEKFLKEVITQITMQVMSPKVVLLFAINAEFLNKTQEDAMNVEHMKEFFNAEEFFKAFKNIFSNCILKIGEILLETLLDFVISALKPYIILIAKKLMLEAVYYYRTLLEQLLSASVPLVNIFNIGKSNMVIDNVSYADIIPKQTEPEET